MAHKDFPQGFGEHFSEILDVDRVLDDLGRGEAACDTDDQVLNMLAAARAEVDADVPQPPNLAELLGGSYQPADSDSQSDGASVASLFAKRSLRRSGVAAATAGGFGITGIVLAGAAAATIAVGGIATYNFVQPKQPKSAENAPVNSNDSTTSGSAEPQKDNVRTEAEDKADKPMEPERNPEESEPQDPPAVVEAAPVESAVAPQPTTTRAPLEQRVMQGLQNPSWTELPEYTSLQNTLQDPFAASRSTEQEPTPATSPSEQPTQPEEPAQPVPAPGIDPNGIITIPFNAWSGNSND